MSSAPLADLVALFIHFEYTIVHDKEPHEKEPHAWEAFGGVLHWYKLQPIQNISSGVVVMLNATS